MTTRIATTAKIPHKTTIDCKSGVTCSKLSQTSTMAMATRATTISRTTSGHPARAPTTTRTTELTTRALTMGQARATVTTGERARTMEDTEETSTAIMDRARGTSLIRTTISRRLIRQVISLILEALPRARQTRQILALLVSQTSMICSRTCLTFQRKSMTHSHPK